MRRSVLVKVPSFSSAGDAGNTTFANFAVSEKKMSCTTRNGILLSARPTSFALPSLVMVSSPLM